MISMFEVQHRSKKNGYSHLLYTHTTHFVNVGVLYDVSLVLDGYGEKLTADSNFCGFHRKKPFKVSHLICTILYPEISLLNYSQMIKPAVKTIPGMGNGYPKKN